MKKIILAVFITLLVFGLVSFVRLSNPITGNVISEGSSLIDISDMVLHNTESDCWVGYDGKVYDVTAFLPRHPGSAKAIIPYCGTSEEFTKAFTKKHGTSKVSNLMKVGTLIGDFQIKGSV